MTTPVLSVDERYEKARKEILEELKKRGCILSEEGGYEVVNHVKISIERHWHYKRKDEEKLTIQVIRRSQGRHTVKRDQNSKKEFDVIDFADEIYNILILPVEQDALEEYKKNQAYDELLSYVKDTYVDHPLYDSIRVTDDCKIKLEIILKKDDLSSVLTILQAYDISVD